MMINKFIAITLFICIFSYCTLENGNALPQVSVEENNPEILELQFQISANTPKDSITLLHSSLTWGKVHHVPFSDSAQSKDQIVCYFLNKDKGIELEYSVSNPLFRTYRVLDEKGNLHMKTDTLDKTLFVVREQYSERWRFVEVKRKRKDKLTELFWLDLNYIEQLREI